MSDTARIEVDVRGDLSGPVAVEWEWDVPDGMVISSVGGEGPIRLIITITDLAPKAGA